MKEIYEAAISDQKSQILDKLLDKARSNNSIDINTAHKATGLTALHMAAQNNCIENIRILVHFRANINVQDIKDGNTPLHLAFQQDNREAIHYLYKLGAENKPNSGAKLPHELSTNYENAKLMYFNRTTQKLINQSKINLKKELQAINKTSSDKLKPIEILKNKIEFLQITIGNILESSLYDKYSRPGSFYPESTDKDYIYKNEILKILQMEYANNKPAEKKRWFNFKDKPEDKKGWFVSKITKLIESYNTDLDSIVNKLSDEYKDLAPPIIWGMPKTINDPYNEYRDAFIYPGSTREKTVYIPFKKIHKKLIEANLIMRNGINHTPNYLIGHLVFIISDRPHTSNEKGKYTGGRRFIDFPIVNLSNDVGIYTEMFPGEHSEKALENFLINNINIELIIIAQVKEKIKTFSSDKSHEKFKIYEVCLFINSQKNICGDISFKELRQSGKIMPPHLGGCEGILKQLMSDQRNGSFLLQLKTELEREGLKTHNRSNNQLPHMFISVSANEYYNEWRSARLSQDAECLNNESAQAINSEEYIDIKNLAGKVILSSSEKWIDRISREDRQQNIKSRLENSTAKKPFYTGFRSARGRDTLGAHTLEKDNALCFDGITKPLKR